MYGVTHVDYFLVYALLLDLLQYTNYSFACLASIDLGDSTVDQMVASV